jgi:hypothetical protein
MQENKFAGNQTNMSKLAKNAPKSLVGNQTKRKVGF